MSNVVSIVDDNLEALLEASIRHERIKRARAQFEKTKAVWLIVEPQEVEEVARMNTRLLTAALDLIDAYER